MNIKLLLKTFFLVAVLALLVLMGRYNQQTVTLSLPPVIPTTQKFPAAYMYYGFFAIGVITGTILHGGSKRGSSKAKSE